jgi:hypothetical protein
VGLDNLLGDGKSQARSRRCGRSLIIRLVELLKDTRKLIGRNSRPGVVNLHLNGVVHRLYRKLHRAALRGELESVRQQVAEHLVDAILIPMHVGREIAATDHPEVDVALNGQDVESALEILGHPVE